jgi:hypothetical protein
MHCLSSLVFVPLLRAAAWLQPHCVQGANTLHMPAASDIHMLLWVHCCLLLLLNSSLWCTICP